MNIIFGGSFDPIHLGHITLCQNILARFPNAKIYCVPNKKNPHKNENVADPLARLELIKLAVGEIADPRIIILDWEIASSTPSFSVFTLERIHSELCTTPTLLMGNDVIESFPLWFKAERIIQLANILVFSRDSNIALDIAGVLNRLGHNTWTTHYDRFTLPHGNWIETCHLPILPYSASELRKHINLQWMTHNLEYPPQGIQRSVWQFIKENNLYSVTR